MRIGCIGAGVVGGTLIRWLKENTNHEVKIRDPGLQLDDSFEGIDAAFVAVPVPAKGSGQDLGTLIEACAYAKRYTDIIFVRSTVLPGTNDNLGTISMPEFLTERRAYEDFSELPIVVGESLKDGLKGSALLLNDVFPKKEIVQISNIEAELSKYAHNCFGAMKVTYFNIIYELCTKLHADFNNVKLGSNVTGFIESHHTQVPGPDGKLGYGGKCFPENISAMIRFLAHRGLDMAQANVFFQSIQTANNHHRRKTPNEQIPLLSDVSR